MYKDINEIINDAANSPKAYMIFNSLKSMLEEEQKKRKQFYETVKEDQKAEFINGEVVFHSPVKVRHNEISFNLAYLIRTKLLKSNMGKMFHEKVMIQLTRNDYEPDICFFLKEKSDKLKPDQMLLPAPDFVVEVVSPSTEKTDRTIKFEDYESHGVKEYWIIDPEKEFVEQYLLNEGKYFLQLKSGNGIISSPVIEGFDIPIRAIFDEEMLNEAITKLIS